MKGNPEFIGRSYTNDEKEKNTATLREWSDVAAKPLEGEIEKSEIDLKMIDVVNSMLAEELRSLGIETYEALSPEKIHILPTHFFKENDHASFLSTKDTLYINKDTSDTPARMLAHLLHELIHRASTTKFYRDTNRNVYDARTGYRVRSPWKGVEREHRLTGFNELMVDHMVYKIFLKNLKLLEKELTITEEEIKGPIYTYMNYGPILNAILKKVSGDKQISTAEVFNALERGQFESNILVLRDIEKSFGKGALEVLALLRTLEEKDDRDMLDAMIEKFFVEEDANRREELRSQVVDFAHQSMAKRNVVE